MQFGLDCTPTHLKENAGLIDPEPDPDSFLLEERALWSFPIMSLFLVLLIFWSGEAVWARVVQCAGTGAYLYLCLLIICICIFFKFFFYLILCFFYSFLFFSCICLCSGALLAGSVGTGCLTCRHGRGLSRRHQTQLVPASRSAATLRPRPCPDHVESSCDLLWFLVIGCFLCGREDNVDEGRLREGSQRWTWTPPWRPTPSPSMTSCWPVSPHRYFGQLLTWLRNCSFP